MSDPFRFNEQTGFITQDSTPRQVWALCNHLWAPLCRLLSSGATLVGVSTSRPRTDLAVTLSTGPALSEIPAQVGPLESDVSAWQNNDTHHPMELGIACRNCRQTLSWPQRPEDNEI